MRLAICVVLLAGCTTVYDFQPVAVGARQASAPRPKSSTQFIRAVYADLIGRAPADYDFVVTDGTGKEVNRFPVDEQQLLLSTLDGVGDPQPVRALIVAGLVASAEAKLPDKQSTDAATFVRDQFHRLLGREPSAYELAGFTDAWRDPAVGPRTLVRAIVGSREYQSY